MRISSTRIGLAACICVPHARSDMSDHVCVVAMVIVVGVERMVAGPSATDTLCAGVKTNLLMGRSECSVNVCAVDELGANIGVWNVHTDFSIGVLLGCDGL